MATALLATGNTATSSGTFTLAAGESTTLTPVAATGAVPSYEAVASAYLEKQLADSSWQVVGSAFTVPGEARVLEAVGTYRITRPAQANSIGVDRD